MSEELPALQIKRNRSPSESSEQNNSQKDLCISSSPNFLGQISSDLKELRSFVAKLNNEKKNQVPKLTIISKIFQESNLPLFSNFINQLLLSYKDLLNKLSLQIILNGAEDFEFEKIDKNDTIAIFFDNAYYKQYFINSTRINTIIDLGDLDHASLETLKTHLERVVNSKPRFEYVVKMMEKDSPSNKEILTRIKSKDDPEPPQIPKEDKENQIAENYDESEEDEEEEEEGTSNISMSESNMPVDDNNQESENKEEEKVKDDSINKGEEAKDAEKEERKENQEEATKEKKDYPAQEASKANQRESIMTKIKFTPNFTYKNLTKLDSLDFPLPYDLTFSDTFSCECYSLRINSLGGPQTHTKSHSSIKICNDIYLYDNNFLFIGVDTQKNKRVFCEAPYEILLSENNFSWFSKKVLPDSICEYLLAYFNHKMSGLLPKDFKKISISKREVYAVENYPLKFLLAQKVPEAYTPEIDKKFLEAFYHLAFVLTKGKMLITKCTEYNGEIYEVNSIQVDEKSYPKVIKFFYEHECGEYCKLIGLCPLEESDQGKIEKLFSDFEGTFSKKKVCEICKDLFDIHEAPFKYCCGNCIKIILSKKESNLCQECKKEFEFYPYYYLQTNRNPPGVCEKCKGAAGSPGE